MKKIILVSLSLLAVVSLWGQKSPSGYYNLTQLSFLIGEMNNNSPSPMQSNMIPSVVMINGHRVDEHFSMGIGVGMTPLAYTIIPVFADFRITFFKDNLSPILAFKCGYSFSGSKKDIWGYNSPQNRNTGGFMLHPEIGVKVAITERAEFLLTIGYWYQHLKSEMKQSGYYNNRTITTDLNRLSFSIGFLFK